MVKQTKKGSIGKKALSAILAASMIMTSSSFVMAAPVVEEVEAVAVEESVAAEEVDVVDENAGAEYTEVDIKLAADQDLKYTGKAVTPKLEVKANKNSAGVDTVVEGTDYTVSYTNNINAGEATATVSFLNSNVEKEFKFTIEKLSISTATVKVEDIAYVYNAKEQIPAIESVVVDDVTVPAEAYEIVKDGMDYTTPGNKNLKLKAKDNTNFTGEMEATGAYEIQKASLKASDVTVTAKQIIFNKGTGITTDDITVVENATGDYLDVSKFDIEYLQKDGTWKDDSSQNINVGTYTFRLVPTTDNTLFAGGSVTSSYEIVVSKNLQTAVNDAELNLGVAFDKGNNNVYTAEYTGSDLYPASFGFDTLTDTQVKVSSAKEKWVDAGKYTLTLEGLNNYGGQTATVTIEVKAKDIKGLADVKATYSKMNDGTDTAAYVVVKDAATTLEDGKDYTYEVSADKKTVTITGKGNYTGTKTVNLERTLMDLNNPVISAEVKGSYTYTGADTKVKLSDIVVTENSVTPYTLVYNTDYEIANVQEIDGTDYVVLPANTASGEVSITVTGKGRYAQTRDIKFNLKGTNFAETFMLDENSIKDVNLTSDGGQLLTDVKNAVKVLYKTGAVYNANNYDVNVYAEGDDKTPVTTLDKIGTYKVVVTPKNTPQYEGKLEATFQVVGTDLNDTKTVITPIEDQAYTGKAVEPKLVVTYDSNPLTEGTDYKVEFKDNIKSGIATATVVGMGNYSGKKSITFNIVGQMDQEIVVLPAQEKALKTRNLNDKATKVKYTTAPETEVTYASSDDKVVTVDAEGNIKYTGLGTATITITAAESEAYKAATVELEVTVGLKQPTFSPSSKNNAFTVTTSTVKGAEKFQVQYVPTGKSFTSSAAKTKTFTVDKKLVKGKISAANKETYRVRVRAISGTTKSKWSPVKTIATK